MVQGTSYKNPDLRFQVTEGAVFKVEKNETKKTDYKINISGTGTVDMYASIKTPTSLADPALTLQSTDTALHGFYTFAENSIPNFIKFAPNAAGVREIWADGLTFTNLNLT